MAARETQYFVDVARAAARLASDCFAGDFGPGLIETKSNDFDLVTEWDKRLEAVILEKLARDTPDIPVMAEESANHGTRAANQWLVDPIDGTVNFSHGLPLWCISIGLWLNGRLEAACVLAPAMKWEFVAGRDIGARKNGETIRVSQTQRLRQSMLTTGFPYDRAEGRHSNFKQWDYFQNHARACRRLGAAALDLCLVASGVFDGYWERDLSPWDIAAGALITQEAGGVVTDTRGGEFDPYSGEILASNGHIHNEFRGALAEADALP